MGTIHQALLSYVSTPSSSLLLDLIAPTATSAYSTRKLRSAYAGSAMRVRRSSDNTEQDIGFVSDDLDTTSLTTFTGANDGFVVTWYDQSGNTRDFTQATAASQPKIVSSGSVIVTVNSNPSIKFDGTVSNLRSTATTAQLATATAWTVMGISRAITANGDISSTATVDGNTILTSGAFINNSGAYWRPLVLGDVSGVKKVSAGIFSGTHQAAYVTISLNTNYVVASQQGGGNLSVWADGGTAGTAAAGTVLSTAFATIMGANNSDTVFLDGYITELVTFASTLSQANMNTLGPSMATRAGKTWTNV